MNIKQVRKNIVLYKLFQLFKEPLFWGPILIIYIIRVSGMTLAEIYFMEAICIILAIFLEIPTGALADLLGRKITIFVGQLVILFATFLFAIVDQPFDVWIANIFFFIGYVLISGADTSFLVDNLKQVGREIEFKNIHGKAVAYRLFLAAFTAIAAGYLAEINIRLPIFLSLIFLAVNIILILFLHEPKRQHSDEKQSIRNLMKISVVFVANHAKLKWVIAFSVLVGVVSKLWFFTYNPYFELVELPLSYFGWIFFVLGLVAGLFSLKAEWLSRKIKNLPSLILIVLLLGVPIILMGSFVVKFLVLVVILQNVVRGYFEPFIQHLTHQYLNSENRATVMSIKSSLISLAQFIGLLVFGSLLNVFSLPVSLQILGVFTLGAGCLLIIRYLRIFKTDH